MAESSLHILVVDDDMMARMTAAQCVKLAGHTASIAENGVEALEMLQTDNYDLILLDLLMPDMVGFEVLKRIKDNSQLSTIPVIMISGAEETESMTRCIEMGACGFLSKPLDPTQLAKQLADCLNKFHSA